TIHYPQPTWVEAAPDDWWAIVVKLIKETLDASGISAEQITGIGLCGLMHALVPVDRGGNAIDRAMLWMDQRCKPQAERMTRNFGEKIRQLTGRLPSTTTSAPKLLWLKENRPDVIEGTYKFLLAKDYIRLKLTGEFATDVSDSGGTSLIDRERRDWSVELLEEIIGVSAEKMPVIRQSTDIGGYVTQQAAAETGLAQDTPVVVGSSDVLATLLGSDIYAPHRVCLYMGTAAWMAMSAETDDRIHPFSEDVRLRYRWLGATATLGACVKWYKEVLGQAEALQAEKSGIDPYVDIEREAAKAPPGAGGLIFIPHLMGERAVKHNPDAKGTLFGLTLGHQKRHVIRAIMEGNAYIIRHLFDAQNDSDGIKEILTVGGGAKSRLWRGIIANVAGKTVLAPRIFEAASLGAAILAGVGTGVLDSVQETANKWVNITDRIEPDPTFMQKYEKSYRLYRDLDAALQEFYPRVE
ncbi:MAG: xylulokinase, partial [Candidatus Poribacteria bacterium]